MTTTTNRPEESRLLPTMQLRDAGVTNGYRYLEGIALPYGRDADIGWFVEQFAPGSLAKSIKEAARSLPLHLFHDSASLPIGVASEWKDDGEALRGVWKLDDGELAQRAARMAQPDDDGHSLLGYMSIRFSPIRSAWTYVDDFNPDLGADHKDHVVRTEARLLEVSLVSTPAYRDAAVEFVRTGERAIGREASGREISGWREYLDGVRS